MNTTKNGHTPGPWHVTPIGSERYVEANGPELICDMQRNDCENPEQVARCDANARLISAAPELLAACKAFLTKAGSVERRMEIHDQARAAIAKATPTTTKTS